MNNIFREIKWQFKIDPIGGSFVISFFVLFLVLVGSLFLISPAPIEVDDCDCPRQERKYNT